MNINELSSLSGVPVDAIKKHLAGKLLAPANGAGRASSYDDTHLQDLFLIKMMVEQGYKTAEIKEALSQSHGKAPAQPAQKAEKPKKAIPKPTGLVKRGRGRPKKEATVSAAPAPKPAPVAAPAPVATPASVAATQEAGNGSSRVTTAQEAAPVIKRGRGRPPKGASVETGGANAGIAIGDNENYHSYQIAESVHIVFTPLMKGVSVEMEEAIAGALKKSFEALLA